MRKRKTPQKKAILFPDAKFLPETRKRGNYLPIFNKLVFHLTLLGATDPMIAQSLGINYQTLDIWKRKYPDLLEAMKRGKEIADGNVAYSLYKSATGYTYTDTVVLSNKVKKFANGKLIKEYTEPLIVKIEREMPANVTAAVKWLSARQPDKWGHKLNVKGNLTVNNMANFDFSGFTMEELQTLSKMGLKTGEPINTDYEDMSTDD
jgi:hypothetical protein